MNLDNLENAKNDIEQQFNNLSNSQWVANQLNALKAKFELISELINNEKEENAAAKPKPDAPSNSNNDKGK